MKVMFSLNRKLRVFVRLQESFHQECVWAISIMHVQIGRVSSESYSGSTVETLADNARSTVFN